MYKENIMFNFLKKLFGRYETTKAEVPYKVEVAPVIEEVKAPEPAKCGCGRSPTGNCVGLHALTTEAWAVHPDNPKKAEPVATTLIPTVVESTPSKPKAPAKPRAPKKAVDVAPKVTTPAPKKAARPKKPKAKQ
jgi:hypothetical protein